MVGTSSNKCNTPDDTKSEEVKFGVQGSDVDQETLRKSLFGKNNQHERILMI